MGIFDKWTKKATVNAIETTKETLNDKLETYSGVIKAGLTLVVIGFGGKMVSKREHKHIQQPYPQPIVINNYFDRGYVPNGGQGKNRQQYQKWR